MPKTDRSAPTAPHPRLRVAYLGDPNSYSRSLLRLRALSDRGDDIFQIPTAPLCRDSESFTRLPLTQRIARKLGFHADLTGAGAALVQLASSGPLDLIWVDKGLSVRGRALLKAKALTGAKVVSFSEDDMALAHNRSRRWVEALPVYDLVVTTKVANIEQAELEGLGAHRVFYVNQAFDPHQHFPTALSDADRTAFGADLLFIGYFEEARARSILALARAGMKVRIWGPGWSGKLSHPNVTVEGRWVVNTDTSLDYSKALTASKIGLGFLRKLNRDQHTSRSVEIPACGSMLLAERTPVHLSMFKEGVEAEFFGNDEELVSKARDYLDNEDKRQAIALAGHQRCVGDYSSAQQMELILKALGMT